MDRISRPYAGHRIKSPELRAVSDKIARIELVRRTHRGKQTSSTLFYMRCETVGCLGDVAWQGWRQFGWRNCRACRDAQRSIFGLPILSQALWEQRHRIIGAGRRPSGATYFLTKCREPGCESVRRQSSTEVIRDRLCIHCWGKHNRRVPTWQRHYNTVKRGALRRQIPFSISFEWFVKTCAVQTCFYCRRSLERVEYGTLHPSRLRVNNPKSPRTHRKANLSSYLDRIDPQQGYSPDNLTMACWPCNKEKRELFTAKQWLVLQALRQDKPSAAIQIIQLTDAQVRDAAVAFASGQAHPIADMRPREEKAPVRGGWGVTDRP